MEVLSNRVANWRKRLTDLNVTICEFKNYLIERYFKELSPILNLIIEVINLKNIQKIKIIKKYLLEANT